jgi:fermentation-respiration switch protein FrsA (DUF1100 family)
MRLVTVALAIVAGLCLLAFVAIFAFQRSLIYPAPAQPAALPAGYQSVALHTADGLTLKAAYRAALHGKQTVVFFHGNGDSWEGAAVATSRLAATGYGVLLPEYRGYAGNPGHPTEAGLYADGRAALAFLKDRHVTDRQTVLIGNSLGSGVATQMATEIAPAALVLISPFTSLPDAAAKHFPWLPVRLLLRDRFDNLAKIGRVGAPVLVLHGRRDAVIAFAEAGPLSAAAKRGTLIPFPEAGHELAYSQAAQEVVRNWLIGKVEIGARPG